MSFSDWFGAKGAIGFIKCLVVHEANSVSSDSFAKRRKTQEPEEPEETEELPGSGQEPGALPNQTPPREKSVIWYPGLPANETSTPQQTSTSAALSLTSYQANKYLGCWVTTIRYNRYALYWTYVHDKIPISGDDCRMAAAVFHRDCKNAIAAGLVTREKCIDIARLEVGELIPREKWDSILKIPWVDARVASYMLQCNFPKNKANFFAVLDYQEGAKRSLGDPEDTPLTKEMPPPLNPQA